MREDLFEPSRRELGDQPAELVQPGRVSHRAIPGAR
jgi:hypothetical protein